MNTEPETSNILVVDDFPETAELVARLLQRHGYEAVGATDPQSAMDLCKSEHFDLLISDIQMPGMTGWEFLREVRRQQSIPAIAISGHFPKERAQSKAAGFDEHLPKPLDLDQLVDSVQRVLCKPDSPN